MVDESSTHRSEPLADLITLAAGPIAAVIRSFDQLRRGSEELIRAVENFNTTMTTLNDTAARVNRLLGDVEEPVRAMIPQITRTVRMADEMSKKLAGPIDQVAPGLNRLADTLNAPMITSFPTDLSAFVDAINDLVRRLSPLGQIAESAGGLFGLRIPGMTRPATSPAAAMAPFMVAPPPPAATPPPRAAAKKAAAKKAPAKKAPREEGPPRRLRRRRLRRARSRRPSAPDASAPLGQRRRTNGVATIVPASAVPRTSIVTGIPASSAGGTKPRAMPWPSTGEKFPLVTTPTVSPSTTIGALGAAVAGDPRWRCPRGGGCTPRSRSTASAARPRKLSLPHATTHPSPACSGVMPGPSSWPCNGSAASRRRVSRAPRPAGTMPALVTASHTDAATSTGRRSRRPCSPVYPVPATVHGVPSELTPRRRSGRRPLPAAIPAPALGLRALFFLVKGLLDRLVYLSTGLAIILAFIGVKLILHWAHGIWPGAPEISTNLSLLVIVVVLDGDDRGQPDQEPAGIPSVKAHPDPAQPSRRRPRRPSTDRDPGRGGPDAGPPADHYRRNHEHP